ncbi:hypothetical protein KIW84_066263 [Lathyrus oleraceus]|uniref:Uncharacterized protein n=1 Tax=Pisum sativum TaxID=3888 RepID=A0A9D5AAU9_PEA|nr:hypothetical protein KIW84_066263 [Pisum sativum]
MVASAIGVCIPLLNKVIPALSPEKDIFFFIKTFAAGVILSTSFIHVLPDAFDENLTSPCLKEHPWGDFPFTGFLAMGTLMVETYATSYFQNQNSKKTPKQVENHESCSDVEKHAGHEGHVHVHTHASHVHAHGQVSSLDRSSELLRHRIISQVLELGIVVHSVIIGISLGTSESPKTIKPLVAALTFHQFFEGSCLNFSSIF